MIALNNSSKIVILLGCISVGIGCSSLVALDLSIDSDRKLCNYFAYYSDSVYRNRKQYLIDELTRRGVTREKCIELTGSEGVYASNTYQRHIPPQEATKTPPSVQSKSGSGFIISKMGHVITNAHVVEGCQKVNVGANTYIQTEANVISADKINDLALLKLFSLNESKSIITKLETEMVPLVANGLLRFEDVELGEKVLVAGYPYGDIFSNSVKVTTGIVSSTRGVGDNTGQFQMDAAVQDGNSGGPIYDSRGNIVGVVVAQLDKLKVAKASGSIPENVNFGIKASTVRQFLVSNGLSSKRAERTEEQSTKQLAQIAKNQALMVVCSQ